MYLESKHLRCLLRMQINALLSIGYQIKWDVFKYFMKSKRLLSCLNFDKKSSCFYFLISRYHHLFPWEYSAGPISWINCIKRAQINVCQSPNLWHAYFFLQTNFIFICILWKWILKSLKFIRIRQNITKVFSFKTFGQHSITDEW